MPEPRAGDPVRKIPPYCDESGCTKPPTHMRIEHDEGNPDLVRLDGFTCWEHA